MTIHKRAGLSDWRFSNQHLLRLIINDDRYEKSRKRIENTDVLIIDDISMLSLKMFEQLEFILRNIRQCNFPFRGIQIV
jgi:DNA replication protein DnaC